VLAPGTVLVSRYRVLSQIGRGGMGAVFLVEHVHTGDRAALKVLHGAASTDPESIERFKREARAPATIQSENVVRVLDADTAPELDGAPFLVMELLTGNDLQKIIAQNGPLPPAEVCRVLGQVARALDKAHAMGIVHRDLKPENLFLHQREDGTSVVKILDFGISKTMDDAMLTGGALTRTGAVMGTPLYMAYEQAMGRRELIGPGTDIWALGLIAIFLLTGQSYWQGQTVPDILGKVLSHAFYPPSSRWPMLGPGLDAWIQRSCARMPDQRFRTAGEQIGALTEILRNASSAAIANAPTMLPTPAYMTPPHVTPPHVTPPQVTPPYVTPRNLPPMQPIMYAPPGVGASTNEPLVHTARGVAPRGMSTGAKIALIVVPLFLLLAGATTVIALLVVPRFMPSDTTSITFAPPPVPTETVAPTVTGPASIEPLVLGVPSSRPQVVPQPTATATATAAATSTATHAGQTREQCRSSCKTACVDANDMQDCLVKCLKHCPTQ
jgi:eukaryotic-like serine/threonine-protein kinase